MKVISNWINVMGLIITAYISTFYGTFFNPLGFDNNRIVKWLFGSFFNFWLWNNVLGYLSYCHNCFRFFSNCT